MLTAQVKPDGIIKAGKFGRSGKMIIKAYSVPPEFIETYKKAFFKNVNISICGCWEWKGRIHNGYGCFTVPCGNTKWAHRVSYAIFNGPIQKQMHIDHKCRNRICVNPSHLQQVTPIENYLAIRRRRLRDERIAKEDAGQLTLWQLS